MGDRISISLADDGVVLFSHWDGLSLLVEFDYYMEKENPPREVGEDVNGRPIYGYEDEQLIMVDFLAWLLSDKRPVRRNYYLARDTSQGDNSDNGHYVYDFMFRTWRKAENGAYE